MSNEQTAEEENAAGMAYVRSGRAADAIPHFERASNLLPDDEQLLSNLGAALVECRRFEEALTAFDAALARKPDYPQAHHNRGVALRGLGRLDESIEAAKEALRLRPDYADALVSLGTSLAQAGRWDEARVACRQALALQPNSPVAAVTLGTINAHEGKIQRALELFGFAISVRPDYADAYRFAGMLLQRIGRFDEAIACFERSAELEADSAEDFLALGHALASKRRYAEAISALDRAIELEPDNSFAEVQRLHMLCWQCDWNEIAKSADRLQLLGVEGQAASPFGMLPLDDDPSRHRIRSERFAEHLFGEILPMPRIAARPRDNGKIRLGYVSADFHNHATAQLTARLFELHDKSAFEVHAFSHGPNTGDSMRSRLVGAFDGFHDISALDDEVAAQLIRDAGIDVAIDLKGYTEGQRLGILARRPAPIQISYLAYPGTTGAPFIDYLVADPWVIPASERDAYSECLIVLPHCYQPTDNRRPIGERPSRGQAGLPDDGFVFACFNHRWKIGPREFDCWAELLRRVDGSLLWLLSAGATAEANLRREIGERGIDPGRLVFAPYLPQSEHLARLGLADLFLDTFNYGAHTTASDALWAGVPVVTCAGRGFATRVATSIVHAAGLSELAASTHSDYFDIALGLAQEPARLESIRQRIARTRETVPIFDSESYARHFEAGIRAALDTALAGKGPADIVLAA